MTSGPHGARGFSLLKKNKKRFHFTLVFLDYFAEAGGKFRANCQQQTYSQSPVNNFTSQRALQVNLNVIVFT